MVLREPRDRQVVMAPLGQALPGLRAHQAHQVLRDHMEHPVQVLLEQVAPRDRRGLTVQAVRLALAHRGRPELLVRAPAEHQGRPDPQVVQAPRERVGRQGLRGQAPVGLLVLLAVLARQEPLERL